MENLREVPWMRRSPLSDWLSRGTGPLRFWKYFFYFLSRSIIGFCLVHFYGIAFPQKNFTFPGPTSEDFWLYCFIVSGIFAAVFDLIARVRGNGRGR